MLGNVPGARQIYERWMSFEPDHHGWMSYIKVLHPLFFTYLRARAPPKHPSGLYILQHPDESPVIAQISAQQTPAGKGLTCIARFALP